jgi:glycosyltransferase involved in cell wall biosynthesis
VRILLDYRPALRDRSGVGEYVHQLTCALAAQTDGLTVFSSSWKDRVTRSDLPAIHVVDRRVPVKMLNLLWHRLEWPPVERLTGQRYDVVHSGHPLLTPSLDAAQVITIHDLDFLAHPERTRAEVRRDYPVLARAHAQRADRILVPSRYTAQQVEEQLGIDVSRISICPHGRPPWTSRSRMPEDGYVLFLGTLEPRKNVGTLLTAYAALIDRHSELPPLLLAGTATPAAEPWLASIQRPPLAGRVRHIGYVQAGDRRALYEGARVLVLPSLEEGFGLPVLEAMTVGVPVVAADRGALPEVLGDAGALVEAEDADALAGAIERMIFDSAWADACASRGALRSRHFTWRAAADAALAAYGEAIRTRAGRGRARRRS